MAGPSQPYVITGQSHAQAFRPDGTFGGTWTIDAEAHGVKFSVEVPDEQYNAPTVHQLLADKAATIAAVAGLPNNAGQ